MGGRPVQLGDRVVVRDMEGNVVREGFVSAVLPPYLLIEEHGKRTPLNLLGGIAYREDVFGVLYQLEIVEEPLA